jgi:hypothetical protein
VPQEIHVVKIPTTYHLLALTAVDTGKQWICLAQFHALEMQRESLHNYV